MVRLLVTGSRRWRDEGRLRQVLDEELAAAGGRMVLIEGEASGADTMARWWATSRDVPVERFRASWAVTADTPPERIRERDGRQYDVAAGVLRNQRMLEEGQPTRAVAFRMANSRGTQDMMDRLARASVPTRVIEG